MAFMQNRKRIAAFTLIEIIIASAIFSMFCIGVFAFYRMGSQMFITGSWKLTRQKDAERFLAVLKERIEQAANATSINPALPTQITTSPCNFLTLNNNTDVSAIPGNRRLMTFTVSKPDMTSITPGAAGLLVYHCLMAVPAEKNLYTLHLNANTQAIAFDGVDYFNIAATFKPDPAAFTNFAARFSNAPANFGLGSVPYSYKLHDVSSTTLSWSVATGGAPGIEADKVVGIKVRLQNPNHPETYIDQSIQAKLDMAVPLVPFALGGF